MSNLFSNKPGKSFDANVAKIASSLDQKSLVLSAGVEDLIGDKPKADAIKYFQDHNQKELDDMMSDIAPVVENIMNGTDVGGFSAGNNSDDVNAGLAAKTAHASQMRAAKQAATILALAGTSPENARTYQQISAGDGAFDAGLNAFDPTSYREMVARSIAYTPASLAQGVVAELLFTTVACTPEQAVYQFRVLVPTLYQHAQHNKTGKPYELNARRLIDATRYQDVLRHDLIDIIPMYKADRAAYFVDTAIAAPQNTTRGTDTFPTSAIRMGEEVDLIALNSLEENSSRGTASERDMLDKGVGVKSLLLEVTDDSGAKTIFVVDTSTKASSGFFATAAANTGTELNLNLDEVFHINAQTPTWDGAAPAVLNTLLGINPNASVGVRLKVGGKTDTETATTAVSSMGAPKLNGDVWERSVTGTRRTNITDPATQTEVNNAFTSMQIVGWVPKAKLRNTSLRDIGQLVRVQEMFKPYPIEMQSPFTAHAPVGEESSVDKAELRKLAFTAAKIDNDMAAHRTIWEHVDQLRAYKGLNKDIGNFKWDQMGYVSDPFIDPFFDEITVDLLRDTQNNSSGGKLTDIGAVLSLGITDLAMNAIRESNINAALDMLGASNYKVSIVAVTDPYIAAYIRTIGDARTAGVEHKVIPASTTDELFRGKILITLRVDVDGDAGILNTGFHLAVPRYVTDATFARDGAVANEVTVQNRRTYVVTTPIMGVINVKNLTQAVRNNVRLKVAI